MVLKFPYHICLGFGNYTLDCGSIFFLFKAVIKISSQCTVFDYQYFKNTERVQRILTDFKYNY